MSFSRRPYVLTGVPLLVAAGTFMATFAIALALFGDESEEAAAPIAPSPTMTATPGATSTPTTAPTVTPVPSTPTPVPTPVAPAGWEEFEQSLAAAVDSYGVPGRYAVAVTDLQSGYTVSVNGEQHQLTGCVVNLFVLISAMRDVEGGVYGPAAVDDLIASTIWSSNAASAYELYKITGGGDAGAGVAKVQALFDSLGLLETQIDHPPAYSGDGELAFQVPPGGVSGASVPDDSNNWTTALDMNRALVAFYEGSLLGPEATADLLERLSHVKPGLNYLVAAVPGDATVSHKNGFFPNSDGTWVDNDIGIVRIERDGVSYAYAISFFSDSVNDKYSDIALGQELSRLAYDYFAGVYGS